MPTLVLALRDTFKGCDVEQSKGVGMSSHHCTVTFDVYEVRIIMSRIQNDGTRNMQFRFMQRLVFRGRSTKVIINEVHTKYPKHIFTAIKEAKGHLLGCVHAIHRALNEKPVSKVSTVDDLFREESDD